MTCIEKHPAPPDKKGVGYWNNDGSFQELGLQIDALNCSWYYNWTAKPDGCARRIEAEFVPMIWDGSEATEAKLKRVRNLPGAALLGFNEPDRADQADMSVRQAIELWPRLMKTGKRLGSPAPSRVSASRDWLARFMKQAEALKHRVDFICLHWYGDVTDPGAVDRLRDFLESQWRLHGRPIWLTEFSGSTGSWLKPVNPPVTRGKNAAFLREALPMLNSLPYLERYAWFEMKWTEAPWAKVALVHSRNGRLTEPGRVYRGRQLGRASAGIITGRGRC